MVLVKKKGNFYRAVIKLLGILFLIFVGSRQHAPAFPNLPTWSGFPRFAGAHVGVALLAKPLSFVEPRQHAPAFPDLPAPMLAPTSPQSLCPSSSHANTPRLFPTCRRPCWRRPSRKALALRRVTPTRPGFSRPAGAHVGVDLPAKPLPFVESRQHAPAFPDLPAPMLAPCSRKALSLRPATPTRPGFFQSAGVFVGVDLPAKPLPFVEPRRDPKV